MAPEVGCFEPLFSNGIPARKGNGGCSFGRAEAQNTLWLMTLYDALTEMLNELESHQLQVVLVPAKEPKHCEHHVRVAIGKNPKWYRELCSRYPSSRRRPKFDTRIRRYDTLRTLTRLIDGNGTRSRYARDLIRIAKKRL